MVTTVSPTHAFELLTDVGGFGLQHSFRQLGDRLVGIRNGIDIKKWNPADDAQIAARFTPDDMSGKTHCKATLQDGWGLPRRADVPLFGMSARLAGADFLMMPSLYEPCGLTQMRAQLYGALPVARRVGGLADTIDDGVTGILYDAYSPEAFDHAVQRAVTLYQDHPWFMELARGAMRKDFSWRQPAEAYAAVYRRAAAARAIPDTSATDKGGRAPRKRSATSKGRGVNARR